MELENFTVINFKADNSTDFVPSTWISADQLTCHFPSTPPIGFHQIQQDFNSKPRVEWPCWDITIIKMYGK